MPGRISRKGDIGGSRLRISVSSWLIPLFCNGVQFFPDIFCEPMPYQCLIGDGLRGGNFFDCLDVKRIQLDKDMPASILNHVILIFSALLEKNAIGILQWIRCVKYRGFLNGFGLS